MFDTLELFYWSIKTWYQIIVDGLYEQQSYDLLSHTPFCELFDNLQSFYIKKRI